MVYSNSHKVGAQDRHRDASEVGTRSSRVALEANLQLVRLPSILQVVESELHTGRLELTPGGVIEVVGGQVVGAQTDSGLERALALHELFFAETGRIAVVLDESVRGTPLGPMFGIIMDGAKLIDEWTQLAEERWLFAESTPVPPERAQDVALLRGLFESMNRGASLGRAFAQLSKTDTAPPRAQLVPALLRLAEAGLVQTAEPLEDFSSAQHEVPPKLPDAHRTTAHDAADVNVDDLLARARQLTKSLDFDQAEALLQQALAARPNDRVIAQNLRHVTQRRLALQPGSSPNASRQGATRRS